VLKRSSRQRNKQGEVLSGWDQSSNTDEYRGIRESWSTDTVLGRGEDSPIKENSMSRTENDSDRDSG